MSLQGKVTVEHLRRLAYLYVRQSSLHQVHENRESTARQYDLKRRAQVLGWRVEDIVVIDEDLGISGATSERSGFQRLVAEVGLGRVGLVMGLEVSRLARNSSDWHRLLEICALSNTLILDEDGVYDPAHFNDRLLLGLKGTMSEAELHLLRARLLGGQLNKARRGELWIRPPLGYVYDGNGRMVLDPDCQVQGSVRLLFETFRRTGAAERVVREFRLQGILWPRRLGSGEIVFGPLGHWRVLQILHNPRYAGAYVFGRSRQRRVALGGGFRYKKLPREEWQVFLPNSHPGYISWEEFEGNQARLLENANAYGLDRRKSAPREGVALLQGLVLCGICGKRMTVRYYLRQGHPVATYVCQREGIEVAGSPCQVIPGTGLDEAVGEVVLGAVTPASLEVALEVFEELRLRRAQVDRLHQAQVERAREEAELAGRQYMLVRPENRLVADHLERQWNEKLSSLARVEEEYAKRRKDGDLEVRLQDRERIEALAGDLPRVWKDPRTSARDRKRILRLLVEDITLMRDTERIQIHIRWKGGATTSLQRPLPQKAPDRFRTPGAIVEMVQSLTASKTDGQIAQILNAQDLRSGKGKRFTLSSIRSIRSRYGIESLWERFRKKGWLSATEMARVLGVHPQTARRFAEKGLLHAIRANDKNELLFEPITEPFPKPHQGKRYKDRIPLFKNTSNIPNEVQYEA